MITGRDLTIFIDLDLAFDTPGYNWMSYVLWRSLAFYLPDAQVILAKKHNEQVAHVLNWNIAIKLPERIYSDINKIKCNTAKKLVLSPNYLCVRALENEEFTCGDVKDNKFYNFVNYNKGVGKLSFQKMLSMHRPPLDRALSKWHTFGMSLNERAVLTFWQQAAKLYNLIG